MARAGDAVAAGPDDDGMDIAGPGDGDDRADEGRAERADKAGWTPDCVLQQGELDLAPGPDDKAKRPGGGRRAVPVRTRANGAGAGGGPGTRRGGRPGRRRRRAIRRVRRRRSRRLGLTCSRLARSSRPPRGARYYEQDGYYAKDDPEHREASAWYGRGAEELGLRGPVDPDTFRAVLEGKVPDGSGTELGRRGKDGEILHRPGRDLTFSAPKSVSLAALVGGDARIVEAHDRAVMATLNWVERNVAETRMRDPVTGNMVRAGNQKIVAATFRHDTSRNLDPQLPTPIL